MASWGLARWAGAATTDISGAIAEMRAQPLFPEAVRRAVAGSLELHDHDHVMMRAMKNMNRIASGFLALYLDASGGLTLARVQQLCADLGMMSPGRAVAMLKQLRQLRYIEPAAEQLDRRKKLYTPTAAMQQAFLKHLAKDISSLALVEPEAQEIADRFDRPEVARKVLIRFGERLVDAIRGYQQRNRASDLFSERQAGLLILNALMLSGEPGDVFPPAGPIHFSIAGLARRFGVSRPHVRKLLRDAEQDGLLRRDGEEGRGWLEPVLREQTLDYHAWSFVGFAACAQAALASARSDRRSELHQAAAQEI